MLLKFSLLSSEIAADIPNPDIKQNLLKPAAGLCRGYKVVG